MNQFDLTDCGWRATAVVVAMLGFMPGVLLAEILSQRRALKKFKGGNGPMVNLIEAIQREMNRCRELVKRYEELANVGKFGKAMIENEISHGERAIASGDVTQMLSAYQALRECE